MDAIYTEEYKGYTINVTHDEYPEDPRGWENVATFVCNHVSRFLGDRQDLETCVAYLFRKYVKATNSLSTDEMLERLKESGKVAILPIMMNDGTCHLWLGSDDEHPESIPGVSVIGFAFIEECEAEYYGMRHPGAGYGYDWKKWAYDIMRGEMKRYDQYLNGEMLMFRVEGPDYEGSGSGFYKEDLSYMVEEAESLIDLHLYHKEKNVL